MRLVVDASILIDHLRKGEVWNRLFSEIEGSDTELFIPTIVLFELFSGKSSQEIQMIKKINQLLQNFEKIELNETIARRAGELYRDISQTLDVPDYIIAASALEIRGTVATLNKKHFEQVPTLNIYPIG